MKSTKSLKETRLRQVLCVDCSFKLLTEAHPPSLVCFMEFVGTKGAARGGWRVACGMW